MRYVDPKWWKLTLASCFAAGALLNLAWMEFFANYLFGRAGLGTFSSVNFILPVIVGFAAYCYPKVRVAAMAAFMAFLGYLCVGLFKAEPQPWRWNVPVMMQALHPVLAVACVGYMVLAMTTAAFTKKYRRVGREDDRFRCPACGYLLVGVRAGVCPECGDRAITSRPLDYL